MLGLTAAEPEVPDAEKFPLVQDVALVELHDRVEDCPVFIDIGLAASEAVGEGGGGGAREAAWRWMPILAESTNTRYRRVSVTPLGSGASRVGCSVRSWLSVALRKFVSQHPCSGSCR
jgi:hypothetical protein